MTQSFNEFWPCLTTATVVLSHSWSTEAWHVASEIWNRASSCDANSTRANRIPRNGYWQKYTTITNAILLGEATIFVLIVEKMHPSIERLILPVLSRTCGVPGRTSASHDNTREYLASSVAAQETRKNISVRSDGKSSSSSLPVLNSDYASQHL